MKRVADQDDAHPPKHLKKEIIPLHPIPNPKSPLMTITTPTPKPTPKPSYPTSQSTLHSTLTYLPRSMGLYLIKSFPAWTAIIQDPEFDYSLDNFYILKSELAKYINCDIISDACLLFFVSSFYTRQNISDHVIRSLFDVAVKQSTVLELVRTKSVPLQRLHDAYDIIWNREFMPKIILLQKWIRKQVYRVNGPIYGKLKSSFETKAATFQHQ